MKKTKPALPPDPKVILEMITYDQDKHDRFDDLNIDQLISKMQDDRVNWINLDGLHNPEIIEKLTNHFNLHTLLVEDIMMDQRPKSEEYDEYLYFTLKMLFKIEGDQIDYEQISFVLGKNYLLSFQEFAG